ncbi:MAG: hypothetical protein Q4F72_05790 [Desulfovibrionaceae bacterium]|nr:hypothetical protein [Desulfovibrionaceae bacterium]
MASITNEFLDNLLHAEKTDGFFEALFCGVEEGAYDIVLRPRQESDRSVDLAFELHQRPGRCLVCSLTYGLSGVFKRHPIINANGLARAIADAKGWKSCSWDIGSTREESSALHWIPFRVVCQD